MRVPLACFYDHAKPAVLCSHDWLIWESTKRPVRLWQLEPETVLRRPSHKPECQNPPELRIQPLLGRYLEGS